jgi:hypothetical protein
VGIRPDSIPTAFVPHIEAAHAQYIAASRGRQPHGFLITPRGDVFGTGKVQLLGGVEPAPLRRIISRARKVSGRPDILVQQYLDVFLLASSTLEGDEWVEEHLFPEDPPWIGCALVIEPGRIEGIIEKVKRAGLVVDRAKPYEGPFEEEGLRG